MKSDIKQSLLESGLAKIKLQGYHRTGIQEVLNAVGVPKGSFYHYFRSKEDFALQVLALESQTDLAFLNDNLSGASRSPLQRLRNHFEQIITYRQTTKNFSGGCLLGNMGQEMGDVSDTFASKLEALFELRLEAIADCLKQAQSEGELAPNCVPHDLAEFIFNSWEGALMRMKTQRSTRPLVVFVDSVFDYLLAGLS